jgi:hypothetical protein
MTFATLFTFFVVPVVYLLFERLQVRIVGGKEVHAAPALPGASKEAPIPLHAQGREI